MYFKKMALGGAIFSGIGGIISLNSPCPSGCWLCYKAAVPAFFFGVLTWGAVVLIGGYM